MSEILSQLLTHPSGIFPLSVLPLLNLQSFLHLDSAAARADLRPHGHSWARTATITGKLTYKVDKDIARWIAPRRVLLSNIEFCRSARDNDVLCMEGLLKKCTSLSFKDCRLVTEHSVLLLLDGCTQLVSAILESSGAVLSDAVVIKIAQQNPNLQLLNMCVGDNITDQAILAVAQHCPKLQAINLLRCDKLTAAALVCLARSCPALSALNLRLCPTAVVDDTLVLLAPHLINLLTLSLYSCGMLTDVGITAVATHCSRLTALDVGWNPRITDVGVIALAKGCTQLQSFELSFCDKITSASVVAIAMHCRSLHALDIQCCHSVYNDGISALQVLGKELKFLHVGGCGIDDRALLDIAAHCTALEVLAVPMCLVLTDEAIVRVAERCPKLISLNMSSNQHFTDTALAALAAHSRKLQVLKLKNCTKIAGAGVLAVVQACANLGTIDVNDCPLVTDSDVAELKKYVDVTRF